MNIDELMDTAEFAPPPPGAATPTPRPSTSVEVDLAALSHRGRVRTNNEDHYLVLRAGRYLRTWMTNLPEGRVPGEFEETAYGMAVADGMGGWPRARSRASSPSPSSSSS